jgi:hypothetical protein
MLMQNTKKGSKKAIPVYNNRNCGQNLSAFDNSKSPFLKNYGIDKLAITLDFGTGFAYPKGETPKNWGKSENTHQKTKEVHTKYFRNEENYNATIEEFRGTDYLKISFNPSKKWHDYLLTTDPNLIADQLIEIENGLKEDRVELDYEKAKISRLDIAKNIKLDHPLPHYHNTFDSYQGKRQIKKVHHDSRYWGNGQHQYIVYNKSQEAYDRNVEIPYGISRGELRILTQDKVESIFGSNSLGNIISMEEPYVEKYNDYIKNTIFRENQYNQLSMDFGEVHNMYDTIYKEFGNKAFNVFMKSLGIIHLLEQPNGLNNLILVLKEFHIERTARRHIAELNALANIYRRTIVQDKSFITLNNEIKEKLIIKPNYLIAV